MVKEGRFCSDLYYRLNVFPITLSSLREREGDIWLLAAHFIEVFARCPGRAIFRIPDRVMDALDAHDWLGNVRELQNFIERSVIMTTGSEFRASIAELANPLVSTDGVRTLVDADRAYIVAAL